MQPFARYAVVIYPYAYARDKWNVETHMALAMSQIHKLVLILLITILHSSLIFDPRK